MIMIMMLMMVVVMVTTSKVDGVGRRPIHLANDYHVDDEDRQRNDGERRQVDDLSDVELDQPLFVVVARLRIVVVNSQEVVVLELRSLVVGSDQFQADLDNDASDDLRRQNLQRLTN